MSATDAQEWQGRVGQSWAAEWQRTDRSFAALTSELLRRLDGLEFASALDIGCGAGELSLSVARARHDTQVLGIDISSALIEVARERAHGAANVAFELADGAVWKAEAGFAPQLLMSRHGVMFFAEPASAFANLRAQAAPGAQLLFSCFRPVSENPFFCEVGALLPGGMPASDPYAPGPFAFADAGRVRAILEEAGWQDVEFVPFDFRMIAGAGQDPVSDAVSYFTRIGPAARAIATMDDGARAAFRDRLREFSQAHLRDGEVGLTAAVWIVAGRNGSRHN